MKERAVIPADALPVHVNGSRSPAWWGMGLLITIEVIVFLTLIVSYFYLWERAGEWPIGDVPLPQLLLPTINLGVLLASVVPVYWAQRGNRRGDRRQVLIGMALAGVLAVAWLVLAVIESLGLPYRWDTNAYGSLVWSTIWVFGAFVIALVLHNLALFVAVWQGYTAEQQSLGVNLHALHWYWIVASWPLLYITIYLAPYGVGK